MVCEISGMREQCGREAVSKRAENARQILRLVAGIQGTDRRGN